MAFDDVKEFNGQKYTGMAIGGVHHWIYPNGEWDEEKIAPDIWRIRFSSIKRRRVPAPEESGVPLRTMYHWGLVCDQKVLKVSANEYETAMSGLKYKIGHRRPHWRDFSYKYKGQPTYRQKMIRILKNILDQLEAEERREHEGSAEVATSLLSALSLVQSPDAQKLLGTVR